MAGPHGVMFERLSYLFKSLELRSATVLLAFVRGIHWTIVPNQTRLIVLHEIDRAVTDLCTRHGLALFDDGFPGERDSAFCTIRQILFPAQAAPPGAQPGSSNQ